ADCAVLAKRYAALGIEATLAPFFQDLPKHLAAAQLLIGRAGASTIFELAMAGRPGLLIPYPNAADIAEARALGQEPGSDIFIHGQPNLGPKPKDDDWTWGCIAVKNNEMEEIYAMVNNGTVIMLRP
ncbi:MAG: L,D-transpeptidase family protein, partial [Rhodobacteraceae bacterium]|nr:L,D-transpeptidase family protein [Paracoccaceae bacterium]